ncbi:MAG: hypothetical protein KDF60_13525 [Calditrichaeota bacterium]|nr:hypothetical protein [Calditrichota bacterium]
MKKLILFILVFSLVYSEEPVFEHIFLEDGLSQSYVSDIRQDIYGYLWISTHDGLNRFDGYSFKVFRHIPGDSNSLQGNWINSIFTDSRGRIWIKLGIGGINIYSPETSAFTYLNTAPDSSGLLHKTYNHISETPDGRIIISTPVGLNVIDTNTENTFIVRKMQVMSGLANGIDTVYQGFRTSVSDNRNGLWSLTFSGDLIRFNLNDNAFGEYKIIAQSSDDNEISTILYDNDGNIWTGDTRGNVSVYRIFSSVDFRKQEIAGVPDHSPIVFMHRSGDSFYFSTRNNSVYKIIGGKAKKLLQTTTAITRIIGDRRDGLWITAAGNYLIHYDSENKRKIFYRPEQIHNKLKMHGFLTAIYADNSGNIWLGSSRLGIHKFSPNKAYFAYYADGLKNSFVTSFTESDAGNIYIGTYGGGLHVFNPQDKSITPIEDSPDLITAMIHTKDNNLLIGTANGEVFNYNISRNNFKAEINNLGGGVRSLLFNSPYLYIGTDGAGLQRLNMQTGELKKYTAGDTSGSGTSSIFVWSMYLDKSDFLWLGLAASGLNNLNTATEKFSYFLPDENTPGTLNNQTVTAIYQDSSSKIWLGTYSGGLNVYDPENGWFDAITHKNGLSGNMICTVIPGPNHNLWLSTNNGLTRFNTQTHKTRTYDMGDGLQSNEFFPGSGLLSGSGHIYLGGLNGFNVFHPDSIRSNPEPPGILITDFSIHNQTIQLPDGPNLPFTGNEKINLDYTQNYITFEFTATDYTYPQKNRYMYRMEPIDKLWIAAENRRFGSYSNLKPGNYTLFVKAANNDGVWNERGISVTINIEPPFWQTAWFYVLIVLFIGGSAVLFHRRRLRNKLHRALEIEHIREVEQTNIRSKTARDFHDEMGHRLTRITMLTQQILRKEAKDSELYKLLEQISENANNLYLGTRDFIWAIDPRNDSLFELAVRMKDFGDELFDNTGTDFLVDGVDESLEQINLTMELRRQLPLIFKEGMTNILKHAHAANVLLRFKANSEGCEISLEDDGKGFNVKVVSKGYGLNNMHTRAEKIGAVLKISSSITKGTILICMVKFTQSGVLSNGSQNRIHIKKN